MPDSAFGRKDITHCSWVFSLSLLLLFRDMLHHFPLHVRGRDKFWAVSLPSVRLRITRRHQPWLWLVHVLRLGRPGTDAAGRILMHPRSLSQYPSDCCTETQTGKWSCVMWIPESLISPPPVTRTQCGHLRSANQIGTKGFYCSGKVVEECQAVILLSACFWFTSTVWVNSYSCFFLRGSFLLNRLVVL